MSLRTKFLVTTTLSVLIPLLAYLLLDATLTRSRLVEHQGDSLRLLADVIGHSLDPEAIDKSYAQRFLDQVADHHPQLEVLILGPDSRVLLGADPDLVGEPWHEEGIQTVLAGEIPHHQTVMVHHGEAVLDVTVPITGPDGQVLGAVHLARSLAVVHDEVRAIQVRHAMFVIVVALAVGLFLGLVTYVLVIRRLGELDARVRRSRWTAGEPGPNRPHGDEIDHLDAALGRLLASIDSTTSALQRTLGEKEDLLSRVEGFNTELARQVAKAREELLAAQKELLRAEHLSTIAQLAAGLAHELRNPLFIVRGTAEAMGRQHPDAGPMVQDIIEEVDRVNVLIVRLLELARPVVMETGSVVLSSLLEQVAIDVRRTCGPEVSPRIRIDDATGGEAVFQGDRGFFRQALTSILANACQATDREGEVVLGLKAGVGTITIEVTDDGCGIREEDLPHIFDPFFTRKPGGIGLGLSAAKKVLDLHGAEVEVESEPGRGSRFVIRLSTGNPNVENKACAASS